MSTVNLDIVLLMVQSTKKDDVELVVFQTTDW